jgi:hypothetical protein
VIFVKQQDYIQTVIGNEKVYGKNVVFSWFNAQSQLIFCNYFTNLHLLLLIIFNLGEEAVATRFMMASKLFLTKIEYQSIGIKHNYYIHSIFIIYRCICNMYYVQQYITFLFKKPRHLDKEVWTTYELRVCMYMYYVF